MISRILKFIHILTLILAAGLLAADPMVGPAKAQDQNSLTATDGRSEIVLPKDWTKLSDLHAKAELQAGASNKDLYLIVLTEAKEDFVKMTLSEYNKIAMENVTSSIADPEVSPVEETVINGSKALRQTVKGAYENMRVVYVFTAIEGKKNYFQVLAWTLASRFKSEEPSLLKVINSFKDLS